MTAEQASKRLKELAPSRHIIMCRKIEGEPCTECKKPAQFQIIERLFGLPGVTTTWYWDGCEPG